MAVVVVTAAAVVVRLGDVPAEFPASAPQADSNASAVREAVALENI
jgi:hypothetical protein